MDELKRKTLIKKHAQRRLLDNRIGFRDEAIAFIAKERYGSASGELFRLSGESRWILHKTETLLTDILFAWAPEIDPQGPDEKINEEKINEINGFLKVSNKFMKDMHNKIFEEAKKLGLLVEELEDDYEVED